MDIKKPKNKWWLDPQHVPEAAQRAPMSAAPSGQPNSPVTPGNTNVTIVLPLMDKASKPRAPKPDNILPFRATTPPGGAVVGQMTGGLTPQSPGYTGLGTDGMLQKSNPTSTDLLQRHEGEYVFTADEVNRMGGPQGVESWKHQALARGPGQNAPFTPRMYTQENGGYVGPMSGTFDPTKVVMQDTGGLTTPTGTKPDPATTTAFNPTAVPGLSQPQSNTVMNNYTNMATGKMFDPQHLQNVEGQSDLSRQNNANTSINVATAGLTNQGAGQSAMQGANQQNVRNTAKTNLADEVAKNNMELQGSQALQTAGSAINSEKHTVYGEQVAAGDYSGAQSTSGISQTTALNNAAMTNVSQLVASNMSVSDAMSNIRSNSQLYQSLISQYGSDAGIESMYNGLVSSTNSYNKAYTALTSSISYQQASPEDKATMKAALVYTQMGLPQGYTAVPDGYNPDGSIKMQILPPDANGNPVQATQEQAYSLYKYTGKTPDGSSYTFTDGSGQTQTIPSATVLSSANLSKAAGVVYTPPKATGTQGTPGFKFASQADQDAAWTQFQADAQRSGIDISGLNENTWLSQYGAPTAATYTPFKADMTLNPTITGAPAGFTEAGALWLGSEGTNQNNPMLIAGQKLTISGENAQIQNSDVSVPIGNYLALSATFLISQTPDSDGKFTVYDTTGKTKPIKVTSSDVSTALQSAGSGAAASTTPGTPAGESQSVKDLRQILTLGNYKEAGSSDSNKTVDMIANAATLGLWNLLQGKS